MITTNSENDNSSLDDDMLDIDVITSSHPSSPHSISGQSLSIGNVRALSYINDTFDAILSALALDQSSDSQPEVTLNHVTGFEDPSSIAVATTRSSNQVLANTRRIVKSRMITYKWPGKTLDEAWRFISHRFPDNIVAPPPRLSLNHGTLAYLAITTSITVTKRDIYYRQPELFKKQDTVDRLVDDVAFTCGVTRKDLRVTASPKGLLCGLSSNDEVMIVPDEPSIITSEMTSHLHWILVVEKEASFKTLVEHAFHRSNELNPGLIVTGKGYPDLSTKRCIRHILDTIPLAIPTFGLFDGDPDGLDICRCYRIGSKRSAQESASNLPEMKWLGVDPIMFLGHAQVMNATINLTLRDRTRIKSMLRRKELEIVRGRKSSDSDALGVRGALQQMLMLNAKMEIQAIDRREGGIRLWLVERMSPLL